MADTEEQVSEVQVSKDELSEYELDKQLREAFYETKDYQKIKYFLTKYQIDPKTGRNILEDAVAKKIWPVIEIWKDFELPEEEHLELGVVSFCPQKAYRIETS